MGLIRLITSQVAFSTAFGINQERYCESCYDALFAEYCYVFTFVLLYIWFRQRVFYANKLLNMSYNKFLKFLSVGSLPIILTCTNTIVVMAIYSQSTKAIPGKGCQRLYKKDLPNWSTAAAVTLFILVELLLILLLLYPLTKSQKPSVFCNRCCAHSNESSVSFPSTTSSRFSSNSEVVKSILKRSVIFGSISIFIQITIIIERLTPILDFGSIGLIVLIYNVHVFLLILFVVFSFVNYKDCNIAFAFFMRFGKKIWMSRTYVVANSAGLLACMICVTPAIALLTTLLLFFYFVCFIFSYLQNFFLKGKRLIQKLSYLSHFGCVFKSLL